MLGTKLIWLCLLALLAPPPFIALAQQETTVPEGKRVQSGQVWFPNAGSVSAAYLDVSDAALETITSLPYSAQLTIEHTPAISGRTDAPKTVQRAKFYRDGEGRTRAEVTVVTIAAPRNAALPTFIEIIDPVAGYRFVLDPRSKLAQRSVWPPSAEQGRAASLLLPAAKSSSTSSPQVSQQSLGSRALEGLSLQGSITKTIYPPGFIGNKGPVAATSERWIAPELKIVVMAKSSAPRDGQTTFRLTGVSRKEPDPSLFRVPEGYSIQ